MLRDVVAHRLEAGHQFVCDRRVALAGGDHLEYLAFTVGQRWERGRGRPGTAREVRDHALRDLGTEDRLARGGGADRAYDLVLLGALEEVARAPARIAANTESSSSYMVSTTTAGVG